MTVGLLAASPARGVSATLVQMTVRGALGFLGSPGALESASSAAVLAKTVLSSTPTSNLKAAVAILLAAGFNVLYAGPTREPAVLFRLPPTASAGDHVDFAIDDNTTFQAPRGKCSPNGCVVQGILPAQALAQMKTGKVLSIVYTANIDGQMKSVRVDQLLYGFPESFESLTKASGP